MNKYKLFLLLIATPAVLQAQLKDKADSTATIAAPRGFFDNIMYYLKHTNVEKKKKGRPQLYRRPDIHARNQCWRGCHDGGTIQNR